MVGKEVNGIHVSWVQLDSFRKAVRSFIPQTLAPFDVTVKQEKLHAVRKFRSGDCQLLSRAFVVAIAAKIMVSHRQVRFAGIRPQLQSLLRRTFRFTDAIRIEIKLEKIE